MCHDGAMTTFDDLPYELKEQLARKAFESLPPDVDLTQVSFEIDVDEREMNDVYTEDVAGATVLQPERTVAQEEVDRAREEFADRHAVGEPELHAADLQNPAIAEARKIDKPDGFPATWPLHAIPRRQRNKAWSALLILRPEMQRLQNMQIRANDPHATQEDKLRMVGEISDILVRVGEFLVNVATPDSRDAMVEWTESAASDADIIAAFAWYVSHRAPGEAGGSRVF